MTDDMPLFERYAKEQWLGQIVKKGDYLFDQRIFPDFAFEVVEIHPSDKPVRITHSTSIRLVGIKRKPRWAVEIKSNVVFNDIVGLEHVKKKCKIIMKYLESPQLFGEWAPKNILFYGPPGTGKTMTAKALANATKVPLYLIRATDLIGEHVGEGAKRIQEVFTIAAENAPSIVFIDELDAIGLDRYYQNLRGDVAEVVNALLTEMDGLAENKGVVTIAATNNPIMLDQAIRNRFEEEVEFPLPGRKERLEMMEHYSKTLPLPVKANLRQYLEATDGMSGRDIKERLLKNALHKAIIDGSTEIDDNHFIHALSLINNNSQKPPKNMFV